jgi:hypothetical protein
LVLTRSYTSDEAMTASGEPELRKARGADLEDVLEILDEASSWLAGRGIQQWPSPFPRATIEHDFEHNTVWLASVDRHPVATLSILTTDPLFWGDVNGNAWYLHRFAIRRSVAGIGSAVLELIEHEAARSGAGFLRLDCGVGLQDYYESAGYQLRSSVCLVMATSSPPRSSWICYEKPLSLRT